MMDPVPELPHDLGARYRLLDQVGVGGMAVVYQAEDRSHEGRHVAVKVLKPHLAAVLGTERFLHEIETAARLSHPNILPLLDSGDEDDQLFYVMPFVEGESLRERLHREGQLSVDEVVSIATDVAAALDHAHRKQVIHRDIKPENILLQDGRALVADFGIALAVGEAGGTRLTETGLTLGTPEYMSPEQAAGERRLDHRTDQYSLGCVVYEMVAGNPPFTASSSRAMAARHALDPVPPISTVRPGIPQALVAAIERSLSKAPADRFPSVSAFSTTLSGSVTAEAPLPTRRRRPTPGVLAVLALGMALIGAIVVWWLRPEGVDRTPAVRVAIPLFENRTSLDSLNALRRRIPEELRSALLSTRLAREGQLEIVDVGDAAPTAADVSGWESWSVATGASRVLRGRFERRGVFWLVTADVYAPQESRFVQVLSVHDSADTIDNAVHGIVQRAGGAFLASVTPDLAPGRPPTLDAYRAFEQWREFSRRFEWVEAEPYVRRAIAVDSTFMGAYKVLAISLGSQGRHAERDSLLEVWGRFADFMTPFDRAGFDRLDAVARGDRATAERAALEITRLAPRGMDWFQAGYEMLQSNRITDAIRLFESLDPETHLQPGWWPYWLFLPAAYHLAGDYGAELDAARRGRVHIPDRRFYGEVRALIALDQPDSAMALLADALTGRLDARWLGFSLDELQVHGHADVAAALARDVVAAFSTPDRELSPAEARALGEALIVDYQLERADSVFVSLATRWPIAEFQGRIGVVAALRGQTGRADSIVMALRGLDPTHRWGGHLAWAARIRAVTGDADEAVQLLQAAFAEGLIHHPWGGTADFPRAEFRNGVWLHAETAFAEVRDDPGFRRLMAPR